MTLKYTPWVYCFNAVFDDYSTTTGLLRKVSDLIKTLMVALTCQRLPTAASSLIIDWTKRNTILRRKWPHTHGRFLLTTVHIFQKAAAALTGVCCRCQRVERTLTDGLCGFVRRQRTSTAQLPLYSGWRRCHSTWRNRQKVKSGRRLQ